MMSEVAMATPKTQEKTPAEENVVENSKFTSVVYVQSQECMCIIYRDK